MNETHENEFTAFFTGLGEYYGKTLSGTILEIYWEGLREYGIADIKRAASLHARNPDSGAFFPKLADFERHLGGGAADKGLAAWSKVDRAVRTIGTYRSVVFDDPIIHAVITDMGGWVSFGKALDKEWPFKQNEFVKRYRAYSNAGGPSGYFPVMCGIADLHNQAESRLISPPLTTRVYGDPAKKPPRSCALAAGFSARF